MKRIYTILFGISIFLYILFPNWIIPFEDKSLRLAIPRLFILIISGLFCITNFNSIKSYINVLMRYKFVRYILYFTIWEFIALILIYLCYGTLKPFSFVNVIIRTTGSLLMLFLGFYISSKKDITFLIKYVFWIIFAIYLYGVIDFFSYFFHIIPLENILKFFMNERSNEKVILLGKIPRIQAGFSEAAYYAYFVLLSLPLTYYFSKTKIKLFKKPMLNLVLKKSILPLAWVTLIFSQSPIYVVFAILVHIVYSLVCWKIPIKKKLLYIFWGSSIFLSSFYIFLHINFNGLFLERVQNVLVNLTSFQNLIYVEPSLATRLCSYINLFIIFLHHPIFGCGTGNLLQTLAVQFHNSPVPITYEIYIKVIANRGESTFINNSLFFSTLAEQGIIGFYFYFIAFIFLIKQSYRYEKFYTIYQKLFIVHMRYVLIIFLATSIYESFQYVQFIWLVAPFLVGIFYQTKNKCEVYDENTYN